MPDTTDTTPLFVSTDWLAQHLADPDLVIFDASWHMPNAGRDPRAEFVAGHIPGAVFFDIDAVADHSTGLPHMLPGPDVFAAEMTRLGFGDGMRAVIYDSVGLFSAPRLWWTLTVFGVEKVSILAGGLPAWTSEGRALESGETARKLEGALPATAFTPRVNAALVADAARVLRAIEAGAPQIVDARGADRFYGRVPEPRAGLRSGHMPGAKNIPYGEVIENGRMKDRAGLEAAFAAAGLDADRPVIASCGSGMTACILSLALAASGRTPATVYDGSWTEWGGRENLPVATGED